MKKILLVDDEINILKVISAALTEENFQVETARTGEEALVRLNEKSFDLIISDFKLPGMNGDELLEKAKSLNPTLPFILITAFGSIQKAVASMKKGAYTYLAKPVNMEALVLIANEAIKKGKQKEGFAEKVEKQNSYFNLIGKSEAMQEVYTMIQRVCKTEASILILGESGTGKELVSRAIHYASLRANGPFIPIDCTTIPTELMESELFGYKKGSFTGANSDKIGLLEMAEGGTVFFDEIGDLDYNLQKKMLRFLQEREISPVGGKEKFSLDIRVVAATNRDLEDSIQEGAFRADLFYRLNVITIYTPALRERKEDIPLLANYFLENFAKRNNKEMTGFEDEVMEALINYDWPGNVRELENIVERAVILCPYDRINTECLPHKLKPCRMEELQGEDGFHLNTIEKNIILKALEKTAWNQSKAAILLGISRKQLRTKMINHNLLPKA